MNYGKLGARIGQLEGDVYRRQADEAFNALLDGLTKGEKKMDAATYNRLCGKIDSAASKIDKIIKKNDRKSQREREFLHSRGWL